MPRLPFILLCLVGQACAVWTPVPPDDWRADRPRRQQVQVWVADSATILHAVAIHSDTLSGVPYLKHPSCDACRVSIPLVDVDSLRAGSTEMGWWAVTGAMAGFVVVIMVWSLSDRGD